jgi:hypothetical protein
LMTPRFPPHAYFAHRSGRQEQQVTGEPAICDILAGPRLLFDLEPTEHQLIDSWSIVIGPSPNPGSATRGALGNRRPVSFDCPPLGDKPPGPLGQDDWQQLGEVLPSASRPLYDLSRSTERGAPHSRCSDLGVRNGHLHQRKTQVPILYPRFR